MVPTRPLLWGIGETLPLYIHYLFFLVAAVVLLLQVHRWYRILRTGRRDEKRLKNLGKRIWYVVKDGLAFARLYAREAKMGTMHLLLLWGIIVLTVGTTNLTIAERFTPFFFKGTFYLIHEALMDLAGVFLITGLLIAITNRYILKPSRFKEKWTYARDDGAILALFGMIAVIGFTIEGMRLASGEPAYTALVGSFLANLLSFDLQLYKIFWSVHSLIAMIAILLIPFTKLSHVIAAPLNILTRTSRIAARTVDDEEYMGAIEAKDLQWRDLLSSIACMRCGRCHDACPATNSGTTLSPMFLMQSLRRAVDKSFDVVGRKRGEIPLLNNVLDMEAVWACTTCRACMEMCPVYIEQMEIIGEMRRGIVESALAPPDIRDYLTNIQKQKNPWGEAKFKRDHWRKDAETDIPLAKDAEFEWLWFVGCAHSFDSRNKPIAKKIAKLLADIGVNFAILGREEGCCGNDVRRVGEEGLFQSLKGENLRIFEKYGIERILATSPHCFNGFKNEYENLNVRFILEILLEAIKSGKLKLKNPVKKRVTFHDPCYLGRYNGMYELPREILAAIPGIELIEMPKNRDRSFCCGGGGGNLVREYPGDDRPNRIRAREAASTNAEVLAVACPFCMIMLEDGVKAEGLDDRLQVFDVIELIWESAYGHE